MEIQTEALPNGAAENYLSKINNAIVSTGIGAFLSTRLGELNRFAPEEKHPDEWAAITSGDVGEKPFTRMNTIYELVCQYTDERLSPETAEMLERGVAQEKGSE